MFAAKTRAVRDPGWNGWAKGDPAPGMAVSTSNASQLLTVYGCITRIADVMATMPVDHFTSSGGQRREVTPKAAWLERPNPEASWESFVTQAMWSLLVDGNLFVAPIRNNLGRVVEVWVIDPTRVVFQRLPGQPLVVLLDGRPFNGELLHLPAYVKPGEVRGVNPIENARVALGLGLSAQQFGAGFFENSALPSILLTAKDGMNDEQKQALREGWNRQHRGRSGGVAVATGDIGVTTLTIAPEQAQFLETRRFSAAEIAANLFHVPPDMVGVALEGSSLTYQNMETRWTEFVRSACQPWMTRIERALSWHLLPRPQYLKFNPDAYLRADTKTRYEAHRIAIESGLAKPSERRELEDLPYLPEADVLYAPGAGTTGAPPPAGAPPQEEGQ